MRFCAILCDSWRGTLLLRRFRYTIISALTNETGSVATSRESSTIRGQHAPTDNITSREPGTRVIVSQ